MKQARTVEIKTLTYRLALAEDVMFLYYIIYKFSTRKPGLDQQYCPPDSLKQEAILQSCKRVCEKRKF